MSLVPLITSSQPGWVQASGDGHGGHSTSVIGFAPLPETSRATNGSPESGSWHTFVWQSSDELLAPIQHLFTWMTVFGTVAIALLASLGYVAASRIVTPVRQLQQAARSIGRGELRSSISIQTGDELEDLAVEFNRMNKQLEAAFAGYKPGKFKNTGSGVPAAVHRSNTGRSPDAHSLGGCPGSRAVCESRCPSILQSSGTIQLRGAALHPAAPGSRESNKLRQEFRQADDGAPVAEGQPRAVCPAIPSRRPSNTNRLRAVLSCKWVRGCIIINGSVYRDDREKRTVSGSSSAIQPMKPDFRIS